MRAPILWAGGIADQPRSHTAGPPSAQPTPQPPVSLHLQLHAPAPVGGGGLPRGSAVMAPRASRRRAVCAGATGAVYGAGQGRCRHDKCGWRARQPNAPRVPTRGHGCGVAVRPPPPPPPGPCARASATPRGAHGIGDAVAGPCGSGGAPALRLPMSFPLPSASLPVPEEQVGVPFGSLSLYRYLGSELRGRVGGRDALEGGQVPPCAGNPPPPSRAHSLCPATAPLTPSASFNGICNRQ